MTLQEISSFLNQSLRFKLNEAQIILLLNQTHKLACDQDILTFRFWDNFLTTHQEILFDSVGYVNAIAGDIGLAVVGTNSGSTGTLISFDNTERIWVIETTEVFEGGEPITITTGTGAGSLITDSTFQQGHLGPYDWPISPPVRSMNGVSNVTDQQIFGQRKDFILPDEGLNISNNSFRLRDDYGIIFDEFNERNFYLPARIDQFARTLTLINRPGLDETPRWIYFRQPETITDILTDDSNVLIPETYHMNWVQCLIEAAQVTTKNQVFTREHVEGHFAEWWETMKEGYTPNGKNSNQTNEGQV